MAVTAPESKTGSGMFSRLAARHMLLLRLWHMEVWCPGATWAMAVTESKIYSATSRHMSVQKQKVWPVQPLRWTSFHSRAYQGIFHQHGQVCCLKMTQNTVSNFPNFDPNPYGEFMVHPNLRLLPPHIIRWPRKTWPHETYVILFT